MEDTFKEYTQREDIAILLINQHVANLIRHLINNYTKARATRTSLPGCLLSFTGFVCFSSLECYSSFNLICSRERGDTLSATFATCAILLVGLLALPRMPVLLNWLLATAADSCRSLTSSAAVLVLLCWLVAIAANCYSSLTISAAVHTLALLLAKTLPRFLHVYSLQTLYQDTACGWPAVTLGVRAAQPVPAILEIPSKEHPYDANQDSILLRVKNILGGDLAAA